MAINLRNFELDPVLIKCSKMTSMPVRVTRVTSTDHLVPSVSQISY